jgi:microcystin-dependent protein
LLCYGQAVSRTIYAALFAVISTTYGTGDGSTTFNLPDLRGRSIFGIDNMGGSDAGRLDWTNTPGTTGGEQYHTLTTSEMPVHSHGVSDPGHVHGYNNPVVTGTASGFGGGDAVIPQGAATAGALTGISIQNAGSGAAANNMPPAMVLNFLIKI